MHEVFSYTYAGETKYADALRVRRILLNKTDGRAWTYIRDLAVNKAEQEQVRGDQTLSPEQQEAHAAIKRVSGANIEGVLAAAAVEAFDLPPFDPETGEGCTEMAALTLLQMYMEFAAGKD